MPQIVVLECSRCQHREDAEVLLLHCYVCNGIYSVRHDLSSSRIPEFGTLASTSTLPLGAQTGFLPSSSARSYMAFHPVRSFSRVRAKSFWRLLLPVSGSTSN